MEYPETIPQQQRRSFLSAAWIIAGAATLILNLLVSPLALLFAWMFPLGVFRLLFSPDDRSILAYETPMLLGGWVFYGCVTIFALSQDRRRRFFITFGILCLVLALNVLGCSKMLRDPIKDSF
jgi:hypothetical protein